MSGLVWACRMTNLLFGTMLRFGTKLSTACNLQLVHMGSQVPLMLASSNMEAKSQLLNLKAFIKIWLVILKSNLNYLMQNYSWDLSWVMDLAPYLTQLSTQVLSLTSKKILPSYLKLKTWNPVWSGKSQRPCSQRLRLHQINLQMTWDLGLETRVNQPLEALDLISINIWNLVAAKIGVLSHTAACILSVTIHVSNDSDTYPLFSRRSTAHLEAPQNPFGTEFQNHEGKILEHDQNTGLS